MTSITSELQGATVNPCKLCVFVSAMPADQQEEFNANLRLPVRQVGNQAVVTFLAKRGVQLDEKSVRRHRERHVR